MLDVAGNAETGWPPRDALARFFPLRGLANVLTVLLSVLTAAIMTRIGLHELRWRDTWPWSASSPAYWLNHVINVVTAATVIVFLVWFYCARTNAGHLAWRQRRARAWVVWGWVIPVVNLWIPFQIMGDIWRAGLPAQRRSKAAWLPALWWATWLFGAGTHVATPSPAGAGWFVPSLSPEPWSANLTPLAVAAITLVAIIRKVSSGPAGLAPAEPKADTCR